MKLIITLTITLIAIALLQFSPTKSLAFECDVTPDPWFIEKVTVDASTLPSQLKITNLDNRTSLSNSTNQPIYIVEDAPGFIISESELNVWNDPEVPDNYRPKFKIVNGVYYMWGYQVNDKIGGWETFDTFNDLPITNQVYIFKDKPNSSQVYEDNRPANVTVPDPDQFTILYYDRTNVSEISGNISYTINDNYDPEAGKKKIESCTDSEGKWLNNNRRSGNIFLWLKDLIWSIFK